MWIQEQVAEPNERRVSFENTAEGVFAIKRVRVK